MFAAKKLPYYLYIMQTTVNVENSINVQFCTTGVTLENKGNIITLNNQSIFYLDLLSHSTNSENLKEIERFLAEVFHSESIRLEDHRIALFVLQYFKQLLIEIQQKE